MKMTRRRAAIGVAFAAAAVAWLRLGPLPVGLLNIRNGESTEVVDRNGEVLYEARAGDGSRAAWLDAGTLPVPLIDATMAAEDHRFFRHPGVDPLAIGRALLHDMRHRRVVEGGSTITQQVVKLLLARQQPTRERRSSTSRSVSPELVDGRGLWDKMREAVIALRLEHRLSKRDILALYLNIAPYGNHLTGANRASRAYFGHDASLLTPAQAAFLASLPQRPTTYNPYRDPARARRRQEGVIVRMGLLGRLTPDAVEEALHERLSLAHEPSAFVAPHFVARVLADVGPARPRLVQTTLDAGLQREVEGIIHAQRASLERHGAHNVAVVVLDNASGEWLAWEGSGDYSDAANGGAIDGAAIPRQPGSALKPFTYALAFEEGESPATVLPDVTSFFPTAQDGVLYSPRNYDGRFRGPQLARHALAGSENVPAVVLASRLGVPNLLRFLRAAGLSTFNRTAAYYGLGITLGDAEVRLDELVAAYAMFARGGVAIQPTRVRRLVPAGEQRLVSPRTAFWITDILSDDQARAYAFGRGGSLEFSFPVAAKTGTSEAYHDNWAIGYTRAVTVGVWVGNFDRRPLTGSSGVTGAGPIFHAVMLAAARHAGGIASGPDESATTAGAEGTVKRAVCALSGLAATPSCPTAIDEWLPADAAPRPCTWHRQTPRGLMVEWPAEYHTWAASQRLLGRPIAPPVPASSEARREPLPPRPPADFRVLSPPDGSVYLIDPTLRRAFQTIGLRATVGEQARVEWQMDGAIVGTAESGDAFDWPLATGTHVVSATNSRGQRAAASFVVK